MLQAVVIILFIALLPSHARADERIALLIGNEAYSSDVALPIPITTSRYSSKRSRVSASRLPSRGTPASAR